MSRRAYGTDSSELGGWSGSKRKVQTETSTAQTVPGCSSSRAQRFSYHVEGALVRSLIGKDLTRQFELSGKQLIVRSASPNEHWRVAWEHY
jgi:hypothetical protein